MKLYIKQKIFSFKDRYDIYDENQNIAYYVEGKMFAFLDKISMYGANHQLEYFIQRKFSWFLSEYEIYNNNKLCARIKQRMSLFKGKLDVESYLGDITIEGDFLAHDYTIYLNGNYFGSIYKKWISWGDSYELDIPNSDNAGFFCALVVAIDNCMHNSSGANSSGGAN